MNDSERMWGLLMGISMMTILAAQKMETSLIIPNIIMACSLIGFVYFGHKAKKKDVEHATGDGGRK